MLQVCSLFETSITQAKHRSFDAPHVLHRGFVKGEDRDTRAQDAVHAAPCRFLPSPVWRGTRPGYVFGRGEQGQGYYADASQGERWQEWRESSRKGARIHSRSPRRRRSRSRSRERSKPVQDKLTPAPFDASKLEQSMRHKKPAELTEEQRQAAALARLAERRQAGAGARPGGHGGGMRW